MFNVQNCPETPGETKITEFRNGRQKKIFLFWCFCFFVICCLLLLESALHEIHGGLVRRDVSETIDEFAVRDGERAHGCPRHVLWLDDEHEHVATGDFDLPHICVQENAFESAPIGNLWEELAVVVRVEHTVIVDQGDRNITGQHLANADLGLIASVLNVVNALEAFGMDIAPVPFGRLLRGHCGKEMCWK